MAVESVAAFCETLRTIDAIDPSRQHELELVAATHHDVLALARDLIHRGLLTLWQAQLILNNRAAELRVGSYLLLEDLGEGGMGKVYKARHRLMGRVVALKIIRQERLARPEAIHRFQREVQLAGQISHPNVVMAYDADQIGDLHYFAMEYIDGVDLGKLVKRDGPLPIHEACEYIRQAALGLQHAHERGLIHRDIKPSNLLLTLAKGEALRASLSGVLSVKTAEKPGSGESLQGVIKILDLGLARLRDTAGEEQNRITLDGLVVGTPDYVAPEQARNSSTVDIRADLYALGGTLYFLLTGQPPFPDGTPAEKMRKHTVYAAPGVETLRPEVPAGVAGLVRRLLAKAPEDRFQTPAELAAALEPLTQERGSPRLSDSRRPPPAAPPASEAETESQFRLTSLTQPRLQKSSNRRRQRWLLLGAIALVAATCLAALLRRFL